MSFYNIKNGQWWNCDCLFALSLIPDDSVDMLLVDLPYGTTACKWDSVIPFEPLWEQYNRICTERAAMVFTATQPFTTSLISSNIENFKYDMVWNKSKRTDFIRAKLKPMGAHESVLIFSNASVANGAKNNMNFFPQGLIEVNKTVKNNQKGETLLGRNKSNLGPNNKLHDESYTQKFKNYPCTQLNIASEHKTIHPTQKPVALFEYLIKTYTNEGDTVLDNCAGSGTTAVACENLNRKWICMEQDEEYTTKALLRIANNA